MSFRTVPCGRRSGPLGHEQGSGQPHESPPFEPLSAKEWRAMLRANIEGADAAIQAVVPSMRERSSGRIVSLSPGVRVDGLAGAGHNATDRGLPHRAGRGPGLDTPGGGGGHGARVRHRLPGPLGRSPPPAEGPAPAPPLAPPAHGPRGRRSPLPRGRRKRLTPSARSGSAPARRRAGSTGRAGSWGSSPPRRPPSSRGRPRCGSPRTGRGPVGTF